MEEKILVKSQQYNAKKGLFIATGVILALALLICAMAVSITYTEVAADHEEYYLEHWHDAEGCWCEEYASASDYVAAKAVTGSLNSWYWRGLNAPMIIALITLGLLIILSVVVFLWLKSYELVVTDKRVYGKVAFGKRVDLPNDSISAISMVPTLKGVAVATSSGKISFLLIKNADEVYDTMNKLLMERQEQKKAAPVVAAAPVPSNAGELKQYKELLDSGVISQEEFDAKKKQLLGL